MCLEKEFMNIYGEPFYFRGIEETEISVLGVGYIIDQEGQIANVLDTEDHASVFTEFVNMYRADSRQRITYNHCIDAAIDLTGIGMIIYTGMKIKDPSVRLTGNIDKGTTVVWLPEELTDDQLRVLNSFIGTNKSVFGDREIVQLKFASVIEGKPVETELQNISFGQNIK